MSEKPFAPRRRSFVPTKQSLDHFLQNDIASDFNQDFDFRKPNQEKNRENQPLVEKITSYIEQTLKQRDYETSKELLLAILQKKSAFPEFFELTEKIIVSHEATQMLIHIREYAQLYSEIVTQSHYDHWRRASTVSLHFFSSEQLTQVLDQIDEPEVKLNLVQSVLITVLEEATHFLQYVQFDSKGSPFLSQVMKDVPFYESQEADATTKTEADITLYFQEKGIPIADTYWLSKHRTNYGDEKALIQALET